MSKLYTLEELTESIINDFKLDRSGEMLFIVITRKSTVH